MNLKKFYSDKKRLAYNPSIEIPGFKFRNKLIAFDDRFVTVKKELEGIVRIMPSEVKVKLLDIGVGDGAYEKILDAAAAKKLEVYGVDLSHKQLKRSEIYLKSAK